MVLMMILILPVDICVRVMVIILLLLMANKPQFINDRVYLSQDRAIVEDLLGVVKTTWRMSG